MSFSSRCRNPEYVCICTFVFFRSCWRMSLTARRSSSGQRRWRREIWLYGLRSMKKAWWQVMQELWPEAMQLPPASASKRSVRTPPALQTRSSLAHGCPLQRNRQRRRHILRLLYFAMQPNQIALQYKLPLCNRYAPFSWDFEIYY